MHQPQGKQMRTTKSQGRSSSHLSPTDTGRQKQPGRVMPNESRNHDQDLFNKRSGKFEENHSIKMQNPRNKAHEETQNSPEKADERKGSKPNIEPQKNQNRRSLEMQDAVDYPRHIHVSSGVQSLGEIRVKLRQQKFFHHKYDPELDLDENRDFKDFILNDINDQIVNKRFDLKTERTYGAYEYMWSALRTQLGPQWRNISLKEGPNCSDRKLQAIFKEGPKEQTALDQGNDRKKDIRRRQQQEPHRFTQLELQQFKRMKNLPVSLVKQFGYKNNRYDLPASKNGEAAASGVMLDEVPLKLTEEAQVRLANLLDTKQQEVLARCSACFVSQRRVLETELDQGKEMVVNPPTLISPDDNKAWERTRIGGISGGQVYKKAKKMVSDTQKEIETWKIGRKSGQLFGDSAGKNSCKGSALGQKPQESSLAIQTQDSKTSRANVNEIGSPISRGSAQRALELSPLRSGSKGRLNEQAAARNIRSPQVQQEDQSNIRSHRSPISSGEIPRKSILKSPLERSKGRSTDEQIKAKTFDSRKIRLATPTAQERLNDGNLSPGNRDLLNITENSLKAASKNTKRRKPTDLKKRHSPKSTWKRECSKNKLSKGKDAQPTPAQGKPEVGSSKLLIRKGEKQGNLTGEKEGEPGAGVVYNLKVKFEALPNYKDTMREQAEQTQDMQGDGGDGLEVEGIVDPSGQQSKDNQGQMPGVDAVAGLSTWKSKAELSYEQPLKAFERRQKAKAEKQKKKQAVEDAKFVMSNMQAALKIELVTQMDRMKKMKKRNEVHNSIKTQLEIRKIKVRLRSEGREGLIDTLDFRNNYSSINKEYVLQLAREEEDQGGCAGESINERSNSLRDSTGHRKSKIKTVEEVHDQSSTELSATGLNDSSLESSMARSASDPNRQVSILLEPTSAAKRDPGSMAAEASCAAAEKGNGANSSAAKSKAESSFSSTKRQGGPKDERLREQEAEQRRKLRNEQPMIDFSETRPGVENKISQFINKLNKQRNRTQARIANQKGDLYQQKQRGKDEPDPDDDIQQDNQEVKDLNRILRNCFSERSLANEGIMRKLETQASQINDYNHGYMQAVAHIQDNLKLLEDQGQGLAFIKSKVDPIEYDSQFSAKQIMKDQLRSDRDNYQNLIKDHALPQCQTRACATGGQKTEYSQQYQEKQKRVEEENQKRMRLRMGGPGARTRVWKPDKAEFGKNLKRLFSMAKGPKKMQQNFMATSEEGLEIDNMLNEVRSLHKTIQ